MRRLSRHFKRNDGGNGKIIPSAANYSAPMDEVPGNPAVRLGASFANRAARLSVFAVPSISRRKCCIAAKRRFRSAPRARSPCASVCSVFSTEGRALGRGLMETFRKAGTACCFGDIDPCPPMAGLIIEMTYTNANAGFQNRIIALGTRQAARLRVAGQQARTAAWTAPGAVALCHSNLTV